MNLENIEFIVFSYYLISQCHKFILGSMNSYITLLIHFLIIYIKKRQMVQGLGLQGVRRFFHLKNFLGDWLWWLSWVSSPWSMMMLILSLIRVSALAASCRWNAGSSGSFHQGAGRAELHERHWYVWHYLQPAGSAGARDQAYVTLWQFAML